jgi:hypothetical protein
VKILIILDSFLNKIKSTRNDQNGENPDIRYSPLNTQVHADNEFEELEKENEQIRQISSSLDQVVGMFKKMTNIVGIHEEMAKDIESNTMDIM